MNEKLKIIGDALLQEPEDVGAVWRTCRLYKEFLLELSNLDLEGGQERDNIPLRQGMALGTTWAAYCLDDFLRTKRFIKGIHQAVTQLIQAGQNRPVHLLYAGTGPFATLILPLTRYFTPGELQLTLLEINPISFHNLERVVKILKLEDFVQSLTLADATQYQIPAGKKVDILLSETMQAGLRREAQVPIFHHLLSQPEAADAILIPERIELFLGAYSSRMSTEKDVSRIIKFGSFFCLDRDQLLSETFRDFSSSQSDTFSSSEFTIPDSLHEQYDSMAIFTEIDIFQEQKLAFNESGLTVPLMLRDLRRDPAAGQTVSIAYTLKDEPGEMIDFKNQVA